MKAPVNESASLRTWSHLSRQRRKPSEYEVVSVDTHFYNDNNGSGHQLPAIGKDEPINAYYRRYLDGSPLTHPDWSAFRDPDELTYRTYNIIQEGQEKYVEELLDRFNDEGHDGGLSPAWLQVLATAYTPGRYLMHTLQMASAYEVQIAPTSTMALCAGFQAADQLRWVSHIAYRTVELARAHPAAGFGADERDRWENAPAWQGLRELMEKVLVAYDWGETFVALNLVAKPAIDECFVRQLGRAARRHEDTVLALLCDAQLNDVDRSRRWARAFTAFLLQHEPNREHVRRWVDRWQPLAFSAIDHYCAALGDAADAEAAKAAVVQFHRSAGI